MRAAGFAAALLIAAGVSLFVLSRLVDSMIFHPTSGVALRPAQLGLEAEDVFLEPEPGARVHAFWLPAPGATRALLFLHGNAGNASHRLPNAAELMRLGVHVLLLDYRGYGLSEGRPSEAAVYADARAALAHLIEARGVPERRIVLFGRSLGGAVAVEAARKRALAGVILESTFSSARDVATRYFGSVAGRLAGRRFDSVAKVGDVRAPLLFFHGDRDEIIAYALGRRLFEAAPEPKAFETLTGAGHNDTVEMGGRAYFARIRAFIDEVAPGTGS